MRISLQSIQRNFAALALVGATMALTATPAQADYVFGFTDLGVGQQELIINGTTTIQATSSGWYDSTGFHDPANTNYIAGDVNGTDYNNYFVFSLSGISGTITSAVLSIWNPSAPNNGFSGTSATYTSYDVSTPISSLIALNNGALGIFSDLGTGQAYGSTGVSNASNGTQIGITLNPFALAALQASEGGDFAVGGSLQQVAAVPLPATFPMFILALGAMFLVTRSRQRKITA